MDVIAIIIVIGLLGAMLAVLVAAKSGRVAIDAPEWVQHFVTDLVSPPRSQAEASPSAEARR